jgi:hypothetical protein
MVSVLIAGATQAGGAVAAAEPLSLTPSQVATVSQSRCGGPTLSTAGVNCQGFVGTNARSLSDIFIVGFENNQDLQEKYVFQAAATFDLSSLKDAANGAQVAKAALGYDESSTMRRSAEGESEYGILPTCNTKLGVADAWGGNQDKLLKATPAATAGVAGATTGDAGSWDVTPQLQQWLDAGATQGTFVMSGDDETSDITGQAACLSYVINLSLGVEFADH